MQLRHRITFSTSYFSRAEIERLGVTKVNIGKLVTFFEIDESDEAWPAVQQWVAVHDVGDYLSTKFTKKELSEAKWLDVLSDWHHGYPYPNPDEFGYREATYDLSNYCTACGTGLKQKAPFQMKGEPKWGRREILQMHWIFDEYFVTPDLWRKVFKPHGVANKEVLGRSGKVLQTVVQLVNDEEVDIDVSGLSPKVCSTCTRVKYLPFTRGYFPSLLQKPKSHIIRTKQYFGSGHSAHNSVLVSRQLSNVLEGTRGVSFWPSATY